MRSSEVGQAPWRTFVATVQLLALLTEDIQGWISGFFQAHLAFGGLIWRPGGSLPPASARPRGRNWADIPRPPPSPWLSAPRAPPLPKDVAAGSHSLPLLSQGAMGTEAGWLTPVFCTCKASF